MKFIAILLAALALTGCNLKYHQKKIASRKSGFIPTETLPPKHKLEFTRNDGKLIGSLVRIETTLGHWEYFEVYEIEDWSPDWEEQALQLLYPFGFFRDIWFGYDAWKSNGSAVRGGGWGIAVAALIPGVCCDRWGRNKTKSKEQRPTGVEPDSKEERNVIASQFTFESDAGYRSTESHLSSAIEEAEFVRPALTLGRDRVSLTVTAEHAGATYIEVVVYDVEQMLAVADSSTSRPDYSLTGIDSNAIFWSAVANAARPGSRLATTARGRLARVGSLGLVASLQPAEVELLAAGEGRTTLADGTTIDWSTGHNDLSPYPIAELRVLSDPRAMVAGDPVELELTVRNDGKGDLYRMYAVTESPVPVLDGIPILIGHLPPRGEMKRVLSLPTSPLHAGPVDVTLQFHESDGFEPASVACQLVLDMALAPALAFSVQPVEDGSGSSSGNGDHVVQLGETIDLRFTLTNLGTATSVETRFVVYLEEQVGLDLRGKRTLEIGSLEPGQSVDHTVAVAVKRGFQGSSVDMSGTLTEQSPFERTVCDFFSLKIGETARAVPIVLNEILEVTEAAHLLSEPDASSAPEATVSAGSLLKATGRLGSFTRVELPADGSGGVAWLPSDKLQARSTEIAIAPPTIIREVANSAPVVVMTSLDEMTHDDQIKVTAKIVDDRRVQSWTLTVNGRPVDTEGTRGFSGVAERPAGSSAPNDADKEAKVSETISLRPGENVIEIVAVDQSGLKGRAVATVTRQDRRGHVYALVIGIDHYTDTSIPDLRFAGKDATALAEFLRGDTSIVPAENVTVLATSSNTTLREIKQAIEKYLVRRAVHPEDTVILYFAGHGYTDSADAYLACSDTNSDDLFSTALRRDELMKYWSRIKAERKILLADACHSGALTGRGDNAVSQGLMSMNGKGEITIVASGAKQLSVELEELGHGAFTYALLEGLKGKADQEYGNHDRRVTVTELKQYLDVEVPALAQRKSKLQNPQFSAKQHEGEVFLTKRKRPGASREPAKFPRENASASDPRSRTR